MVLILVLLSAGIGVWFGREWAGIKYQRRIVDLEKEAEFWREVAKEKR